MNSADLRARYEGTTNWNEATLLDLALRFLDEWGLEAKFIAFLGDLEVEEDE